MLPSLLYSNFSLQNLYFYFYFYLQKVDNWSIKRFSMRGCVRKSWAAGRSAGMEPHIQAILYKLYGRNTRGIDLLVGIRNMPTQEPSAPDESSKTGDLPATAKTLFQSPMNAGRKIQASCYSLNCEAPGQKQTVSLRWSLNPESSGLFA